MNLLHKVENVELLGLFTFRLIKTRGHENPKQGGETSGKHIIKKVSDHKANDCQGNGHTEQHGSALSKIRYSHTGKQLPNGANYDPDKQEKSRNPAAHEHHRKRVV